MSNVDASVIEKARRRLMKVIVDGVVNEDFPCLFFASIEKRPTKLPGAYMAVTINERGALLLYDAEFVANAPREQILVALEHELYHLVFEHFLRSVELAGELGMSLRDFMTKIAPFADVVVNHWISKGRRDGFDEMEDKLLTYKSEIVKELGITYDDETFEQVARKVFKQLDNSAQKLSVIMVAPDGTTTHMGGEGEITVTVPMPDKEIVEQQRETIANLIENASRMAGNVPHEIRKIIEKLVEDATPKTRALQGWELFKHLLVGERANGKEKLRTMGRLNRRTLLPPGYKTEGAYNALFVVDESGSVSDDEVMIAHNIIMHAITQSSSDTVYILPYDTEPGVLRVATATEEYERSRCGGTDFSNMFDNEEVKKAEFDVVIVLTDGEPISFPKKKSGVPEIWVITTENGMRRWEKEYGHGVAVLV